MSGKTEKIIVEVLLPKPENPSHEHDLKTIRQEFTRFLRNHPWLGEEG